MTAGTDDYDEIVRVARSGYCGVASCPGRRRIDLWSSAPATFPQKPAYLLGTGESVETPMVSQMEDFTSSRAFRVTGPTAFAEASITHCDVDHLMIYDVRCSQLGKLRASADLRPRGSGLCAARRGRRLHRRAQHGPRRIRS